MKFCQEHWDKLNKAIDTKGLGALVADDDEKALSNLIDEINSGPTKDNFDPLMGAHNAILNRATEMLPEMYGWNPLLLFTEQNPRFVCPICALNNAHREHVSTCQNAECDYPREYDWTDELVDGSTDYMVQQWKELNA